MNVSPETHRYVGIWRPPFETLWDGGDPDYDRGKHVFCPCGRGLLCPHYFSDGNVRRQAWKEARECWLAGHFDTPQYELKEKT